MGRMDGKVAFITGGARGQGRSHALTLAREGADIALLDIVKDVASCPYPMATPQELDDTAADIKALGRPVLSFQGDTRVQADLDLAVATTIKEFGGIDVVVANAGFWSLRPLWEIEDEEWLDHLDINLTGSWRTLKAAAPHLIERRAGSIILIASINGLVAGPNFAHYTAAKHGIMGLMKSAAVEFGKYGVRCNAICPGFVDTKMNDWQACYDMMAGKPPGEGTPEDRLDSAAHLSALAGRTMVKPQGTSNAVLWLASDDSADVTGESIKVDLGQLILPPYNPAPIR
jgi:SDR family mycofactocin-dependent oxidoreductase